MEMPILFLNAMVSLGQGISSLWGTNVADDVFSFSRSSMTEKLPEAVGLVL
jgi:hypothetical protein